MPENNQMMSLEGQLVGMPLAGPESFSQQQLDYLKRALGVDETVLWDTKIQAVPNAEITLSELATNFESIKVWMTSNDLSWSIICEFPGVAKRWEPSRWSCDSSTYTIRDATDFAMSSTNNLKWVCKYSNRLQWNSNGTWSFNGSATAVYIYKVVGVHRIAGGNT